ncbi:heme ABC transporter substrate-binding protein IsdE [Clostridium fallax]|uniref:High-affinity heme uptake system protein IsdE n=1 Tax=Clostridium fallax TaxID=1533 RepID=A0A1M4XYA2_9CLOT|nr:heme ABC transporter substrate-binding protein IsdE [Clostridium fallax]SHE98471.1 iron complex transport system substrate-binding protein [Clostridium fallax]SQB06481.1 iron (III) dicitrate-binding periplasmic protein [Clostridium fallax]
MKKVLALIMITIMSFGLVACGNNNNKPKEEKKSENERVIAGSMAMAEMLAKLDVPIVGRPTTQYEISDKVKNVQEIGLPMNPDLETITVLKPDIYVTSGALEEMIGDRLKEGKINTMFCNLDSYDAVKNTIKEVAKKFNKEENGEQLISEINKREEGILDSIDKSKKAKVMILFGAPGHFMLATKNSFAGSLINKLGGENIADKVDTKGLYIPFSLETALNENPDIIFRMYHGYIDEAKKQVNEEFKTNSQWQKFKAVKNNKIYDLDPKYFGVTGDIKISDSLQKMKEYLYE